MATHVISRGFHNTGKTISANKAYAESIRKTRGKRQRLRTYGYVLLTTVCMLILLFVTKGIAPFGDNLLRYTGDGAQYYGILGYLQNTFFTNNDLLYSWSAILGGNMIGMLAFNAASPFNLLSVLFPDNLMAAYHLIFALKFMSAALAFAVMLEHVYHQAETKAVVLFSASYPFIGYMTYYGWNQSWMDGVILLPLVALGIWKIVNEKKWLLYMLSLSTALYSNYYIGYMVCIASAAIFTGACAISNPHFDKALAKIIGVYAVASVLAVALAAVLLIPTYAALPSGRAMSLTDLIDNVRYTSKPSEMLSMLYTAPFGDMKYEDNYPVVYTGIVQLLLVVLFFLNKEIPKKWKLVSGCLLLFFAVSFSISVVNVIWHGFSENVWFNFRYSFVVSFLLELLAFYSFSRIQGAKGEFALAAAIMTVITVLALGASKENVRAGTLFWDIVWACAGLILLDAYAGKLQAATKRKKGICFILLFTLTLGNLFQNAFLTMNEFGKMNEYTEALETDHQIADLVDDDGLYRLGSTWRYGSSNPMRAGYAGVENFASAENPEAVDAVKRLGIRAWQWRSYYGHNVPLSTDALLGIKYIVAQSDSFKSEFYDLKGAIKDTDLVVYSNPLVLPVIFPTESLFNSENDISNTFEHLNLYWNSVSYAGGDVFAPVAFDLSSEGNDISIKFKSTGNGPVYAFIPRGEITVNVSPRDDREEVFFLGTYTSGEDGELTIHIDGTYDKVDSIVLYQENPAALEEKAATVQQQDISIDKITSSDLKLQYDSDSATILSSTIPFDEGWHVYIDGHEVNAYRNMDTFLAFDIMEGAHEIELRYWPPYLTVGIVVSVITAVGVVVCALLRKGRSHKSDKENVSFTSPLQTQNRKGRKGAVS